MPYSPIPLSSATPEVLNQFVRQHLDMQFHDVHCMMRLPIPELGLAAGCNFAATAILLNLVSGLSTILYSQLGNSGDRFKGILRDFYPWDVVPTEGAPGMTGDSGVNALYDYFRNPLTHALAMGTEEIRASKGKPKEIRLVKLSSVLYIAKGPLDENAISRLEIAPTPRYATLLQQDGDILLFVESLYWGVRTLVTRLTHDEKRMQNAAKFITSAGGSTP